MKEKLLILGIILLVLSISFAEEESETSYAYFGEVSIEKQDGSSILKDSEGKIVAQISEGFKVDSDGKDFITFVNEGEEGSLVIGFSIYKLKQNSKLSIFRREKGISLHLEGEGSLRVLGGTLNNVRNTHLLLDENNDIEYAKFTSVEGGSYSFSYDSKSYKFEVNSGAEIEFDPKESKISGKNAILNYKGGMIDSSDFEAVIIGNIENIIVKEVYFSGGGKIIETVDGKSFTLEFEKDTQLYRIPFKGEIGKCKNAKVSCIEWHGPERYLVVNALSNNNLKILDEGIVNFLDISMISDDSRVLFSNEEDEILFSKDPFKVSKGLDTTHLPVIRSSFVNDKNEICYQFIDYTGWSSQNCRLSIYHKGMLSVEDFKEKHDESIRDHKISFLYGSDSWYSKGIHEYKLNHDQALYFESLLKDKDFRNMENKEKEETINKAIEKIKTEKIPVFPKFPSKPIKTDCIQWCVDNLKIAYTSLEEDERWETIKEESKKKSFEKSEEEGIIGTELSNVLIEKERWKAIYYNPDIKNPEDDDTEHKWSHDKLKETGKYYGVPVSDSIINYRPTTMAIIKEKGKIKETRKIEDVTPKENEDKITQLKKVPFGIVLARGGKHTAVFSYGKVYEVHYDHGPRELELIEVKDFEETWQWLSGVVVIPPAD